MKINELKYKLLFFIQFAFFVFITLSDAAIVYYFINGAINAYVTLSLHFFLVLSLAGSLMPFASFNLDMRMGWITLVMITFLGPIGGAISVLCFILHMILVRMNLKEVDPILRLVPELTVNDVNQLYQKIIMDTHIDKSMNLPTVFMDVLTYGSEAQKRVAIERILRHFRPELSENLKKALNDPLGSIRVFAATAVTRLEKQYSEQYQELQSEVKQDPQNFGVLNKYAKHCEAYSKLEFIDEQRKQNFINHAINTYEACLNEDPDDLRLITALSKLYFRCKYYSKSLSLLKEVITKNNQCSAEILKIYLSSLFELKMYKELRKTSLQINLENKKNIIEENNLVQYVKLWNESSFHQVMKEEAASGNS